MIPAVRRKLELIVCREVCGRLLALHLVAGLAWWVSRAAGWEDELQGGGGERKDKTKPTSTLHLFLRTISH